MFRGTQAARFCCDEPEQTVLAKVRQHLGVLGRVSIDREGVVTVEPAERFHSPWGTVTIKGTMRREWNEYSLRLDHACAPTGMTWAVVAVGTPLALLGWLALVAPASLSKRAGAAARAALHEAHDKLGGAPERRYGRKAGFRPK